MSWNWNPLRREKRRHERYSTSETVSFKIVFDFKTKVSYRVADRGQEKILSKKYSGVSKDISAEGLCFVSSQELQKGDFLYIEIFVPGKKSPVLLDGEVRWSRPIVLKGEDNKTFSTGVKLLTINNKSVEKSVYFNATKQLAWSDVLDSIIGDMLELKLKKKKT